MIQATPFNLLQGNSVYAKLVATNQFGTSLESSVGNGALICLVPSAPQNLVNVAAVTSYSVIGLQWEACLNNGGDLVIDYDVYFTTSDSFTFELLDSAVTGLTYTTTKPLITG